MIKFLIAIVLIFCVTNAYALRISKPISLSNPVTDDQINQLNKFLEEVWLIENGRQELDVVTTSKTQARNGEIWVIYTAPTARIQFKANGTVYTTP